MAGNGTIAIEILDAIAHASGRLPEKGTVYLTVGGGGMCAGVAAAVAARAPGWEVVGCQPQASAVMYRSVQEGKVVHIESFPTLSDGSAGGLEDGMLFLKKLRSPCAGLRRFFTPSDKALYQTVSPSPSAATQSSSTGG